MYVYHSHALNELKAFIPAATDVPITYKYMTNGAGDVPGYAAQTLHKVETTDQNGNKTEEYTDILGRKIAVKKFDNGTELLTQYTYNDRDQVTTIQPPQGATYTFSYYDDGLLHTKTIPDKGTYTYTYNTEDQKEMETLPNGSVLGYTYHSSQNSFLLSVTKDGQPIKEYTPYFADFKTDWVGTEQIATLTGTSIGSMLSASYTYDDIGRVTSKIQDYIDGSQSVFDFQYDNLDNKRVSDRSHSGPGGGFDVNSTYDYDKGIRLVGTTTTFPTIGTLNIHNLTYDDHDWLVRRSIGSGLQTIDYGYEPNGWLASINDGGGGGSIVNEDPCDEPVTPDPPIIDCVGPIVVTDYRLLYNCLDLLEGSGTMMRLTMHSQVYASDTGYIEFENAIVIPVNGGITEPEYTNEESFTLTGSGTQPVDPVLQQILDFLENCLRGQTPAPIVKNAIQAALENTNIGISSALHGPVEPSKDVYYLKLHYTDGNGELEAAPQYNGNISWMEWQVSGESAQQYGFTYDGVDRLLKAKYRGVNGDQCFQDIPDGAYDVWGISYDKIGNIKTLLRNGMTNNDPENPVYGMIDNLTFTYTGTSELSGASDAASPDKGFKASSSAYSYDAVGNLTDDTGKGLTAGYDFLDLPYYIFTYEGGINPIYDANGKKLRQLVTKDGNTETWDYLDGVEFKDGVMQSIYHEDGRIVYNAALPMHGGGTHTYAEWFLKDHLGNTRVRIVDKNANGVVDLDHNDPEVHEITGAYHYYPFGFQFEGPFNPQQEDINRYRYNGKEWGETCGWYDYGARWYDPAVGRFFQVDPACAKFASISTFSYSYNNPLRFYDKTGSEPNDIVIKPKRGDETNYGPRTLANLQKLTDDKLGFASDGKTVVVVEKRSVSKSEGTALVRGLVASPETTTITNDVTGLKLIKANGEEEAMTDDMLSKQSVTTATNEEGASNPKIHSGSIVRYSPDVEAMYTDTDGNRRIASAIIALAHELIHAKHNSEGTRDVSNDACDPKFRNREEEKTVAEENKIRIEQHETYQRDH